MFKKCSTPLGGALVAVCVLVGMCLVASPALATVIFTASGTAGDGRPENAKATIDITSLTAMTIILENAAGPGQLGGISSLLDGFGLTFSTAPTGITLDSVSPGGTPAEYACTSGSCVSTSVSSSPFDWEVTGTASPLLAPNGFKPFGIVNNDITVTDGIPNNQHNPYLNGPVTFSFTLEGLTEIPDITQATFYFGTDGDTQTGQTGLVPEPSAVLLLGSGLLGLGAVGIMRSKRNR